MWDLISNFNFSTNESLRIFIPLTVLAASLAGSWHCAAMCGGIATMASSNRSSAGFYHFGRLLAYLSLGCLAGLVGEHTLRSSLNGILPWLSAITLGGIFIWMGFQKSIHLKMPATFFKIYSQVWKKTLSFLHSPVLKAGFIGVMSVFLPCGWLYAFILAALATQSMILGSVVLFFFWLGTLPALSMAPYLVQKILNPIKTHFPKLSSVLLVSLGLITILLKAYPLFYHSEENLNKNLVCPIHSQP